MIATETHFSRGAHRLPELDRDDLATLRFVLDLALQPVDRWDGFTHMEQIGTSSLRYQLNLIGYALAMAQHTCTPAFTGYLAEAQRNAILKMCEKRVWSYWAYEALLGYGTWNPDPIVRANVMYSGYFGVMVGLYEALNEDRRFSEPGSLALRWNDKLTFRYDAESLAKAVQRNMLADPESPQFPCEPHLVYPICNTFAINTLLLHDRNHDTGLTGDLVDRVATSFARDGWLTSSGRFLSGRTAKSSRIVFPPALGNDLFVAYWLHPSMPELARRTYETMRARFFRTDGERISLAPTRHGRVDPGNYSFHRGEVFSHVVAALAAREIGDEETARAFLATLDADHDHVHAAGARQIRAVSMLTNLLAALLRFSRPGSLRDVIANAPDGDVESQGPILDECAYPDVLVARAVSDGEALDLVLHPGDGWRRTKIAVKHLRPNCSYRVRGTTIDLVKVGHDGQALLEIDLDGRREVHLSPMR